MKVKEQEQAMEAVLRSENGKLFMDWLETQARMDRPVLEFSLGLSYEQVIAQGFKRDALRGLVLKIKQVCDKVKRERENGI